MIKSEVAGYKEKILDLLDSLKLLLHQIIYYQATKLCINNTEYYVCTGCPTNQLSVL